MYSQIMVYEHSASCFHTCAMLYVGASLPERQACVNFSTCFRHGVYLCTEVISSNSCVCTVRSWYMNIVRHVFTRVRCCMWELAYLNDRRVSVLAHASGMACTCVLRSFQAILVYVQSDH